MAKPDPRLRTSMGLVLLACAPGLLALLWVQGWGLLCNLLLCASAALLCEALLLALRGQPVRVTLSDGSALVTAVLLAAALPALAPWWLPMIAAGTAIGIGKQIRCQRNTAVHNWRHIGELFTIAMTARKIQQVLRNRCGLMRAKPNRFHLL